MYFHVYIHVYINHIHTYIHIPTHYKQELVRAAALLADKREEELSKLASAIEEAHTTLGRQVHIFVSNSPAFRTCPPDFHLIGRTN